MDKKRYVTAQEAEALEALVATGQEMISVRELWHILGQRITTISISYWLKNGLIPGAVQIGGHRKWVVPIRSVLTFVRPSKRVLMADDVRSIRERKAAGETLGMVQADYKSVHPNTIGAVWRGQTWKEII